MVQFQYNDIVAQKKKVLVFGSISIDSIWDLPHFPHSHEKIDAKVVVKSVGGSGANTASWLSKLGCSVTLIGAVGDDEDSRWILQKLRKQGIDTKLIKQTKGKTANHAICLVNGDSKRIIRHKNLDISKYNWNDSALRAAIKKVDHVHISSIDSSESVKICKIAKAFGKTLSIEMNGRNMTQQRKYADLLFCNAVELKKVFKINVNQLTSSFMKVKLSTSDATLVVTNGSNPVVSAHKSSMTKVKVKKWKAIKDRTGAGDSFDAGFIAVWLNSKTRNVKVAIQNGVDTSSKAVQRYGGQARDL